MNSSANISRNGGARPGAGRPRTAEVKTAASILVRFIHQCYLEHIAVGGTATSFASRCQLNPSHLWQVLHEGHLPRVDVLERAIQALGGTILIQRDSQAPR